MADGLGGECETFPGNPIWHHTMVRVMDREKEVKFWTEELSFTLLFSYEYPDFTLDFLGSLSDGQREVWAGYSEDEKESRLYQVWEPIVGLTWNRGRDERLHHGNGDVDGSGNGFGHLAVNVPDVYAFCEKLESHGVEFRKKPDEGRMKGLAFALTPTGYWVEILKRPKGTRFGWGDRPALCQTMIRVKDPKISLPFFSNLFGLAPMTEKHFGPDKGDFSLHFLVHTSQTSMKEADVCVIELTHNHGTESDKDFAYSDGNGDAYPNRGYRHVAFVVTDVKAFLVRARAFYPELEVKKETEKLAIIRDPDGYAIELIQKGASFLPKDGEEGGGGAGAGGGGEE